MAIRLLTWLISLGVHGAFALFMLLPTGGVALEQGSGEDIMVVEQGLAIQGVAKLGEDLVTIEPVEAPPVQMAAVQPLPEEKPQEVKPVDEQQVIASEAGPDQENVKEPEPEEGRDRAGGDQGARAWGEGAAEAAARHLAPQESVAARLESSGEEKKGGDATAHRAYLGKLRTHLERSKVNPRTTLIGTAVVRLTVGANGDLVSHKIVKSSGTKVLDDAAMTSIERASPFPPIPHGLQRDNVEVSVPFKPALRNGKRPRRSKKK
jgi:protein TonB